MSSSVIALLPSLSSGARSVEIPGNMRPEQQERILRELGEIAGDVTRVDTKVEERSGVVNKRLEKLEATATASGQYDLAVLQKALEKRGESLDKVKWFVLSIVSTLITSAVVGLVVNYLASR